MAIQSHGRAFNQNRLEADTTVHAGYNLTVNIIRLMCIISGSLTLVILPVVVLASTGTPPTPIEISSKLLPGNVAPTGLLCGDPANESCYHAPVDAHCYESGDDNCLTDASIQQNGKMIAITFDMVSRTIVLTSVYENKATLGDLIVKWGAPTGFHQFGQDVDVYWDTRSAHLTTCWLRPESRVTLISYDRKPPVAHPWRGFVRVNSKDC